MKLNYVHIVVATPLGGISGSYQFPVDMLRYDFCRPASELDSTKITASLQDRENQGPIRLTHHSEGKQPTITPDRWRSFGWAVAVAESRRL